MLRESCGTAEPYPGCALGSARPVNTIPGLARSVMTTALASISGLFGPMPAWFTRVRAERHIRDQRRDHGLVLALSRSSTDRDAIHAALPGSGAGVPARTLRSLSGPAGSGVTLAGHRGVAPVSRGQRSPDDPSARLVLRVRSGAMGSTVRRRPGKGRQATKRPVGRVSRPESPERILERLQRGKWHD